LQGYYRQSAGGSPAASGQTTYLLTGTSTCQTNASCTGTADEVKTTISFGPQTAGTANNLLPVSSSSGAGDGSLTATTAVAYDSIGNATYLDGPLAGTADTTRTIYDAARQVVGQIGPDPDGAGTLKNRAQRITYNADGQVTKTEAGTTSGQSDTAWTGFTRLLSQENGYDGLGYKWFSSLTGSDGAIYSYFRYGYDALGRQICAAQRMNPVLWPETAQNPCQLATEGAYGPDRIVQSTYDDASRLVSTTSAYATTDAGSDGALTFTDNGKTQTFTDGEGHVTTFEYDGFDRLVKTHYPNASGGGSSTTDYEQLTYGDPRSLVTSRRLRDGQLIGFSYDALARPTLMDLPGVNDVSYGYDLLGRLKTSSNPSGHLSNYGYDALGRATSEQTTYGGTKTSQYDLAGRRTRFNWGSAWADYDHLVTGEVSAVRENGATSGAGVLATYTYDDLGRRKLIARGNGTTTGYNYDPVSRLSTLSQDLAGTANDLSVTFGYNPAGQIVSRTGNNDAYAYTGHANQDLTETSNGRNQLTAQGSTALTYDGRGNVTAIGSATYSYDALNRLVGAAGKVPFYDTANRLDALLTPSGGSYTGTTFDFDGASLFMEKEYGTGAVLRRFVPGASVDEPLVWYEGSGTTTRRWFHADERGSVIAVSDASGNAIGINKYDDYGQPQGTLLGRFGYTGQAWLPEIGLAYYKARMYHPGVGRFVQPDPIGYSSGQNMYGYVAGDPVNFADPSGTAQDPNPCGGSTAAHCGKTGYTPPGTGSNIGGHTTSSAPVYSVSFGNPAGSEPGSKGGGPRGGTSGSAVSAAGGSTYDDSFGWTVTAASNWTGVTLRDALGSLINDVRQNGYICGGASMYVGFGGCLGGGTGSIYLSLGTPGVDLTVGYAPNGAANSFSGWSIGANGMPGANLGFNDGRLSSVGFQTGTRGISASYGITFGEIGAAAQSSASNLTLDVYNMLSRPFDLER
jgi:RHS repeat-associated protein